MKLFQKSPAWLDAGQLSELLERTDRAITDLEARNEAGDDPAPVRLPEWLADREALRRRVRRVRPLKPGADRALANHRLGSIPFRAGRPPHPDTPCIGTSPIAGRGLR